jgi:hypothetical protein
VRDSSSSPFDEKRWGCIYRFSKIELDAVRENRDDVVVRLILRVVDIDAACRVNADFRRVHLQEW